MAIMELGRFTENLEKLFTVKEAAAHIRCTPAAVYSWIDDGLIRICPIRGSGKRRIVRIPESALRDFLAGK